MSDTNLTPEQAVERIGEMFNEKSATFSTKEELEATTNEMKSQIESLKGLEEKSSEIEKAIARFEGRLEAFGEKAKVVPTKRKGLGETIFDLYAKNIEAIKTAVEKGGKVALNTKDTTITNDYTGTYALTDFDSEVDRTQRKRYGILENVNTGSTTGKFVTYVQQTRASGIGWTDEAKPKEEGEPQWSEISEEVKKIASYVKVSKEMLEDLSFIRAEINNDLMLSVKEGIEEALLNGTGASQINGLLSAGMALPAFNAGVFALAIPFANITDLIRVVMAQIEAANFTPTHVIMNPQDIATLQLTKGTDGLYTYPMYLPTQDGMGEMRVAGMRVISSTYMAQDKYLIGDLSQVSVRFRDNIAMTVGLDADDFTRNMITILAEARLVQYVKNNKKPAFVFGTISTDVVAITAP